GQLHRLTAANLLRLDRRRETEQVRRGLERSSRRIGRLGAGRRRPVVLRLVLQRERVVPLRRFGPRPPVAGQQQQRQRRQEGGPEQERQVRALHEEIPITKPAGGTSVPARPERPPNFTAPPWAPPPPPAAGW